VSVFAVYLLRIPRVCFTPFVFQNCVVFFCISALLRAVISSALCGRMGLSCSYLQNRLPAAPPGYPGLRPRCAWLLRTPPIPCASLGYASLPVERKACVSSPMRTKSQLPPFASLAGDQLFVIARSVSDEAIQFYSYGPSFSAKRNVILYWGFFATSKPPL
jgi:hypothetical protein